MSDVLTTDLRNAKDLSHIACVMVEEELYDLLLLKWHRNDLFLLLKHSHRSSVEQKCVLRDVSRLSRKQLTITKRYYTQ